MTNAVQVTFAKNYIPGVDMLYTYLVEDNTEIVINGLLQVDTSDGPKLVRVISQKVLTYAEKQKLESLYGPLKFAKPLEQSDEALSTSSRISKSRI